MFETRFTEKIALERITHVEVPCLALEETKVLFKKYRVKIEVLPIEVCEIYNSTLPIMFFPTKTDLPRVDYQEC
jgi:hypothetical protein